MGDVPPVLLLDRVRGRIRVKHYSIRTEQAHCDGIKRFIHIRGKRHPPEVEAYLRHLIRIFIDRSWPTSTDL